LKWDDLDFRQKIIYIVNTKNNEKREIPMNQVVFNFLLKVKKHPNSPYVFCNKDGKPYSDVKKAFWHALKRAGIGRALPSRGRGRRFKPCSAHQKGP